ncbi:hypothetical protein [Halomontanus rarus]|uniref:hypothetical protein n=1 Tax=Halomontanus rarus TaxID=3034020 RepID=UPI001F6141AB
MTVATDGGTVVRISQRPATDTDSYEFRTVRGGTLVFEPLEEYSTVLGRSTRTGRELVGFLDVDDWNAIRKAVTGRGYGAGIVHQLPEFDPEEVR